MKQIGDSFTDQIQKELEEPAVIHTGLTDQDMVITPGAHYIPNELYNELIRLNYYGIIDFLGDQGSPRGV